MHYNSGWQHDADGRVTQSAYPDDSITSVYDAAGRLTKVNSETKITQSYDGNSAVSKRATETYREDQNGNGTWTTKNKYLIRSSVMGGETVTEADDTGRKTRTIVRAAGAELAWQNVGYYNNTVSELVFFQHNDASGMSYRTAQADGTIIGSYGTEGAAAELDPLGGNVGTITSYFQINTFPGGPEIPTLQNMNEFSPRGADGQRVQIMWDGIEVPFWMGTIGLSTGSVVIDFANTSRWALQNAGIYAVWRPDSGRDAPPDTPDDPDGPITVKTSVDGGVWSYYFTNTSWNPIRQTKKDDNSLPFGEHLLRLITQVLCDNRLARIFGGDDAVMATIVEPKTLRSDGSRSVGRIRNPPGNENPEAGVTHLFPNSDGTGVNEGNAYTPSGYEPSPERGTYTNGYDETQNFIRFFYKPGSLSQYGYDGGLIVNFTHIGPTNNKGIPAYPNPKKTNDQDSVLVGVIGGYGSPQEFIGGSGNGFYVHVHMIFNSWNGKNSSKPNKKTRIDPRTVFCNDLGF